MSVISDTKTFLREKKKSVHVLFCECDNIKQESAKKKTLN